MRATSFGDLRIDVELQSIATWRGAWARRSSRVTLLLEVDERFVVVMDPCHGFWFLPRGGVEQGESVEEAARREATEELGLEVKVNGILKTFYVTLISRETKEQLKIPPFTVVQAHRIEGQLKTGYAPNRKIHLVRKDRCNDLPQNFDIPTQYDWMKPYFQISQEIIKEFSQDGLKVEF
jgi:hypothetical protein